MCGWGVSHWSLQHVLCMCVWGLFLFLCWFLCYFMCFFSVNVGVLYVSVSFTTAWLLCLFSDSTTAGGHQNAKTCIEMSQYAPTAASFVVMPVDNAQVTDSVKAALVDDVAAALYCSKICSYAQGMNIIRARSEAEGWGVDLGQLARIWKVCVLHHVYARGDVQCTCFCMPHTRLHTYTHTSSLPPVFLLTNTLTRLPTHTHPPYHSSSYIHPPYHLPSHTYTPLCAQGGCIIRASFLDSIKQAYYADASLPSLLVDPGFVDKLAERNAAWRRVVGQAIAAGAS